MQEHHPDAIENNIETHPVKLAIYVALGSIALIIGIMLMVQLAVGSYGIRSRTGEPAMAANAVAKRIAPVAHLAMDPKAPSPATAPVAATKAPAVAPVAMPAPTKTAAAPAVGGKAIYAAACSVCHTAGIAGAPKLGDKAVWTARLKDGKPALYASAIKGKGAMPPKGGNTALPDADVRAAVDYLVGP